jgi:hypothetical protein
LAKKKPPAGTVNKSDVIRKIIAAQPGATRSQIQAKLQERGVKASDALINKIKYHRNDAASKKTGKAGRNGVHSSKADAIRSTFAEMGVAARSRDIIASLKSRGIVVTSAQVSTLRRKFRDGSYKATTSATVPLEHLRAAKELAQRLGGLEQARQALDSFASLMEG